MGACQGRLGALERQSARRGGGGTGGVLNTSQPVSGMMPLQSMVHRDFEQHFGRSLEADSQAGGRVLPYQGLRSKALAFQLPMGLAHISTWHNRPSSPFAGVHVLAAIQLTHGNRACLLTHCTPQGLSYSGVASSDAG